MNLQIRPKLFLPLALLAAPPALARTGRQQSLSTHGLSDLRRLVAAMID